MGTRAEDEYRREFHRGLIRKANGEPDLWHRPDRGPAYWDWRCLRCGEPVDSHPSWWERLLHRWGLLL